MTRFAPRYEFPAGGLTASAPVSPNPAGRADEIDEEKLP